MSPEPAILWSAMIVLLAMAGCASQTSIGGPEQRAYLAAYFVNNGAEGVFLAGSDDGLKFSPLVEPNVPVLTPGVGKDRLMRDPCLFRGPDGRWHLTWTTGWWDTSIGLAHSDDLVSWSGQRELPVMGDTPGTLNSWAPEITFEPGAGLYVIFWSSTVEGRFLQTLAGGDPGPRAGTRLNHRIYRTTTRDFETYSPAELMLDPGFNCIDATLLPPASTREGWLLFVKDETLLPPAKNIRVVRCADPLRITERASKPITGSYWAEGPMAYRAGGRVRVLFDRYTENRFGGVESADLTGWTDLSDAVTFPQGARHGSVVEVDQATIVRLRRELGSRGRP